MKKKNNKQKNPGWNFALNLVSLLFVPSSSIRFEAYKPFASQSLRWCLFSSSRVPPSDLKPTSRLHLNLYVGVSSLPPEHFHRLLASQSLRLFHFFSHSSLSKIWIRYGFQLGLSCCIFEVSRLPKFWYLFSISSLEAVFFSSSRAPPSLASQSLRLFHFFSHSSLSRIWIRYGFQLGLCCCIFEVSRLPKSRPKFS